MRGTIARVAASINDYIVIVLLSFKHVMTSFSADPVTFASNLAKIAEQSQHIVQEFAARNAHNAHFGGNQLHLSGAFAEWFARMMADPQKVLELQLGWWQETLGLWQATAQKFMGEAGPAAIEPEGKDRRFKDKAWQESIVFDFIKQFLSARRALDSTQLPEYRRHGPADQS